MLQNYDIECTCSKGDARLADVGYCRNFNFFIGVAEYEVGSGDVDVTAGSSEDALAVIESSDELLDVNVSGGSARRRRRRAAEDDGTYTRGARKGVGGTGVLPPMAA